MLIHTRNTLPEPIRQRSVDLLNQALACAIDLRGQVKHAHWNVRGPAFIAVHELFDKVAEAVDEATDMIAERAGALGGTAHGKLDFVREHSTLIPYPLDIADEVQHLAAVASALATFGEILRNGIASADQAGDEATVDLFTAVTRDMDQELWKVESHLYRG
jgi:starvation-inducible DNA-binding protein